MPPLKNIRHEKFAQEILNAPSNTEAYTRVYPQKNREIARVNASLLLSSANVRERVLELMQSKEATNPEFVVSRLGDGVRSENEGIMMDAVKTCLKVWGCFEEKTVDNSINSINVVFGDAVQHKDGA